jgi:hypothetical protein
VEHPRKFDVDWFHENVRRLAFINAELEKVAGRKVTLELRVGKRERNGEDDKATVELPYEGDRLAQLVRETFKVDPPETKS